MRNPVIWTAFALLVASNAIAASPDVYTGTWRLDVGQSTGAAQSQVLTISVSGGQESYRSELVNRDGSRQVTNYTARYDGKEYQSRTVVTESNGKTSRKDDTVILRKLDERTRERQWRRDGRVIRVLRRVVSQDGTTLTSQVIDVDPQGHEHPVATLVFSKSRPG